MTLMEKTVPLATRVAESDYEAVYAAANGDLAQFVRDAVAAKMETLGRPISTKVGKFGGKQAGAGRPDGARDKQPRKRK